MTRASLFFLVAGVINVIANVLDLPQNYFDDSQARTKAIALSQLTV
ncbi:hypothetical protein Mic7113_6660 (plasmid) [Allocoleopsis franciscana PCC 7113]|uniref:Uncharacterized protein n=1 Tax=Allocoleopsis franciscana PCC 7113 TaxID=1173027 RepID=K9WPA4_9CYAN|nr:hypothetical protein Mic7113_6660 [Allocoleopsis franciscana PCC 7113]